GAGRPYRPAGRSGLVRLPVLQRPRLGQGPGARRRSARRARVRLVRDRPPGPGGRHGGPARPGGGGGRVRGDTARAPAGGVGLSTVDGGARPGRARRRVRRGGGAVAGGGGGAAAGALGRLAAGTVPVRVLARRGTRDQRSLALPPGR